MVSFVCHFLKDDIKPAAYVDYSLGKDALVIKFEINYLIRVKMGRTEAGISFNKFWNALLMCYFFYAATCFTVYVAGPTHKHHKE